MSAQLLTSKDAQPVRDAALAELKTLAAPPKVVAVHNPESPAARYYLRAQKKTCGEAGVAYEVRALEPGATQASIIALIRDLNRDPQVSGITVHTPLPAGVDQDAVMSAIHPNKDIEGIHPENLGRLAFGVHWPAPCAASAAVELARLARPSFKGLDAVVVGRSALVGKAIALLLLQSKGDAPTPTLCHTATADLGAHTRRADLLFAAAGRTDDFRKLRHNLFLVATNLDTGASVTFGAPGRDHVPISIAIEASAALPGLFPPVRIGGEYYEIGRAHV